MRTLGMLLGTGFAAAALTSGCATPQRARGAPPPLAAQPPAPASETVVAGVAAETAIAGHSTERRPIAYSRIGDGPFRVLLLATIHGNEAAGTPLLEQLDAELRARGAGAETRTVVIVPVANPDGLARGRRANAQGVDLNRNFPSANWRERRTGHGVSPASEPETQAILGLIERFRPHRIVSIHQPIGCIDYDGPARGLAEMMAAACNLPVRKLGARPGSLGAYAGEDGGIPTITLELPGHASRLDDEGLWARYGLALMAAVEGPASSLRAVQAVDRDAVRGTD